MSRRVKLNRRLKAKARRSKKGGRGAMYASLSGPAPTDFHFSVRARARTIWERRERRKAKRDS